jgi:diguanylate cyclase (GGDEF)-like protein
VETQPRPIIADELFEVVDADPGVMTILIDDRQQVRWVSSAACRAMLGCEPAELVGESFASLGGDLQVRDEQPSPRAGRTIAVRGTVLLSLGAGRPAVTLTGAVTTTRSGTTVLRVAHHEAASTSYVAWARDPLTGLVAREELPRLGHDLPAGGEWLVLMVELDRFDSVVARVGAFGADAVLRTIAARLQAFFREGDVVVRSGARQFTIVVRNDGGPGWPEAMAERLMLAIGGPIPVTDGLVSVASSIGLVTGDELDDGSDPFEAAAAALDTSLVAGGGRWTRIGFSSRS